MRQWANKDFVLSKSDPSLNKIAWGQGQGVFSRPQQPSGVEGALCPGREARRVSKPAMNLWFSVSCCYPEIVVSP